jgi:hypothetical protein
MSIARSGVAAVAFGGKIYAIGGSYGGSSTSLVEAYDPTIGPKGTWTPVASALDTNPGYSNGSVVATATKIILIGGPIIQCLEYTAGTDTWAKGYFRAETQYLWNPASAINPDTGKVYISGGYKSAGVVKGFYEYGVAGYTWWTHPDMPEGRSKHGLAVLNGKVYAIGGSVTVTGNVKTVDIFDLSTTTWSRGNDMITARDSMATAVVGGSIFVAAGCCDGTLAEMGTIDNLPVLSWPTGTGYGTDGVDFDMGHGDTTMTFRVHYEDADGQPPMSGYPILHILKGGVSVDVLNMTTNVAGTASNGDYQVVWPGLHALGTDYTYYIEVKDSVGGYAVTPTMNGPTVSEGVLSPADLAANLPPAGQIQVRQNVINFTDGRSAYIVVRAKTRGTVNLDLYTQAGSLVMSLPAVTWDSTGLIGTCAFDGRLKGKPLPGGIYYVVASGALSYKQKLMIVSPKEVR